MNKEQFIGFVNNPGQLNDKSVMLLEGIVKQYPYCQTAQLLYTKNLHAQQSIHYEGQLKKAAACITDRKILYQLIMQQGLEQKITEIEGVVADESVRPQQGTPNHGGTAGTTDVPTVETAPGDSAELTAMEKEILEEAIRKSYSTEDIPVQESEPTPVPEAGSAENVDPAQRPKDGKRPFSEWVKLYRIQSEEARPASSIDLIEKFIREEPQIKPKTAFFSPTNVARLSIVDDAGFVTETLAKIYLRQGHYEKARKAYEHLKLKNPEKSSYFAALIREIDELIDKK